MKKISTLVKDIQDRITSETPFDEADVQAFGHALAQKLANRLSEEKGKFSLRMSNLGTACHRKLWYQKHMPEKAQPLSPATRLKFLFGDIVEEVVLFLARAAGHDVQDEQKEVELHGVRGHIDGIVDGRLVDVKSASGPGFTKFKTHNLEQDDPFGYLDQLGAYCRSLGHTVGSFLAVDKSQGHITLDTYPVPDKDYEAQIATIRQKLAFPKPPQRGYQDEKMGESGNRKLGVVCSYCPFKAECWPSLELYLYKAGNGFKPVYLTKVAKPPRGVPVGKIGVDDAE